MRTDELQHFDFSGIIELLDCGLDLILQDVGESVFLRKLREVTGADGAMLIRWLTSDPGKQLLSANGNCSNLPAALPDWLLEQTARTVMDADTGPPCLLDALNGTTDFDDVAAYVSDPTVMGALLDNGQSHTVLVLLRDQRHWQSPERAAYRQLAALIRKSILIHKRITRIRNNALVANAIFNSSPRGMIALTDDGTIAIANSAASAALEAGDAMRIRDGKLHFDDKAAGDAFAELLNRSSDLPQPDANGFVWHHALARADGARPFQLSVTVTRLPGWSRGDALADNLLVMYVTDPDGIPVPTQDQLRALYGLTPAQAQLAIALWGGTSIRDAAADLSISINTARSHLRAIYEKLGVDNHAEMMAILATTISRLGPADTFVGHHVTLE